jgi:uncharacterized protein YjbJ (UPF0337 family)
LGPKVTGTGFSRSASPRGRARARRVSYFPRLWPSLGLLPYRLNARREWLTPQAVTCLRTRYGEQSSTKNRIAGSIEEVKGAAKEAIGKAVGDAKLQNDGKADKAVGKIQNAVDGLSDAVRDAL